MNENTPPENGTNEPAPEPEATTQTITPEAPIAVEETPSWAREKVKRNGVVAGAAVAGAVVALAGAALVGDDDQGRRDFRGGPPGMQGQGGPQQWGGQGGPQGGPQGGGQFRGPDGQGQGPGMQGPGDGTQDQQQQPKSGTSNSN